MPKKIIKLKCPNCGNEESEYWETEFFVAAYCTECKEQTYHKTIKPMPNPDIPPRAKCPYCGSTATHKISKLSKAANIAAFGIFAAGKVSKQWHCDECKSDF